MISNKQKALIHVAKAQLNLDDTCYRQLLETCTGVTTSKSLDQAQFQALMKEFERLGFATTFTPNKYNNRINAWGCTPKQEAKIQALWQLKARNKSEQALIHFIERTAKVSHPRWLTIPLASNVITAIEKL